MSKIIFRPCEQKLFFRESSKGIKFGVCQQTLKFQSGSCRAVNFKYSQQRLSFAFSRRVIKFLISEKKNKASCCSPISRNHENIHHRDRPDSHPISAITGLQDLLDKEEREITLQQNRLERVRQMGGIVGPGGIKGDKGEPGTPGHIGPEGPMGPEGSVGHAGRGIHIAGAVTTHRQLLNVQNPKPGEARLEKVTGTLWIYDPSVPPEHGHYWHPIGHVQGPPGHTGLTGPQGAQGMTGSPGHTGPDGPQGGKGDPGVMGHQGVMGLQGVEGVPGHIGQGIEVLGSVMSHMDLEKVPDPKAGDVHLEISSGDLWIYDPNQMSAFGHYWHDIGHVAGPPGHIGQTGVQGVPGVAGPLGHVGPDGPRGASGTAGHEGHDGVQGVPGIPGPAGHDGRGLTIKGAVAHPGELAALSATALPGDSYISAQRGDLWIFDKDSAKDNNGNPWHDVGHLQGPPGHKGDTGPQGGRGPGGVQGHIGVDGPVGPAGGPGTIGHEGVQGIQGIQGIPGHAGTGIHIKGSVLTHPDLVHVIGAHPGDTYLELDTGNLWVYDPSQPQVSGHDWHDVGHVQGQPGHTGADGPEGPRGIPGPAGHIGIDGPVGPKGAAGTQGVHGIQGIQGIGGVPGHDGLGVHIKGVVPDHNDLIHLTGMKPGDGHLVSSTGFLWIYDPGIPQTVPGLDWHNIGHLTGPAGHIGKTGDQGVPGIQGVVGAQGVPGHVGTRGPSGHAGPAGHDSAVPGPTGPAGHDGTDSRVAGPKGDTGPAGPKGSDGIHGLGLQVKGAIATHPLLEHVVGALPGDTYLETDTGDLWIFDPTQPKVHNHNWHSVGHIKGPQGDKGDVGAKGSDGPPGVKGGKGDPGTDGAASIVPGPPGHVGAAGADSTVPGPKGAVGDKGATGSKGGQGVPGIQGPPGHDGTSIHMRGVINTHPELEKHTTATGSHPGDAFFEKDTGHIWVFDPSMPKVHAHNWHDFGMIRGPIGPVGPKGVKGDKGDKGDRGNDVDPAALRTLQATLSAHTTEIAAEKTRETTLAAQLATVDNTVSADHSKTTAIGNQQTLNTHAIAAAKTSVIAVQGLTVTNKAGVAANKTAIATNKRGIATNKTAIATNTTYRGAAPNALRFKNNMAKYWAGLQVGGYGAASKSNDFNNAEHLKTGIWWMRNTATHGPAGKGHGILMTINSYGTTTSYMAQLFFDTSHNKLWVRMAYTKALGTWKDVSVDPQTATNTKAIGVNKTAVAKNKADLHTHIIKTTGIHGSTAAATANKLMIRDAHGGVAVGVLTVAVGGTPHAASQFMVQTGSDKKLYKVTTAVARTTLTVPTITGGTGAAPKTGKKGDLYVKY